MADTKWKDHLLKSSLPLEHSVAELLATQQWYVWGQYSYARKNEKGIEIDFSADIHAGREYSSKTHWLANLEVLVECKYSSPGVKWIFLPYPETAEIFSGVTKVFDQAANKRITDRKPLEAIEEGIDYCIRGIALHDSGFDENAIHRGAYQLRYAMPRIAERTYSYHSHDWHDEDMAVTFACAILVTNAPIFCLKPGIRLKEVFAAEALEDVATLRDRVILWEKASPDYIEYTSTIYEKLLEKGLGDRIKAYRDVFKASEAVKHPPGPHDGWYGLENAGSHILVTSLDGLGPALADLDTAVRACIPGLKKIAEVRFSRDKHQTVISPAEPLT